MVADSSAWIELMRSTGSPAHLRLRAALQAHELLVITDPVMLELLAGALRPDVMRATRRVIAACRYEPVRGIEDWEDAAELHRACRHGGKTVRAMLDCVIAAVAIRLDMPVLHADRDFDVLARHTPLRVVDA